MQYENKEFWEYYNKGYAKVWSDDFLKNINSHNFICSKLIKDQWRLFDCEICGEDSFFILNSNRVNISCAEYLIKKLLE